MGRRQRMPSKKALDSLVDAQLALSQSTPPASQSAFWTMDWFYRGANFERDILKKAEYTKLAQWLTDALHEKGAPDEWVVAFISDDILTYASSGINTETP